MTRLISLLVKTVDTYLMVFFFGKVNSYKTRISYNSYIRPVYIVIKYICLQYNIQIQHAWPCVGNGFLNSSKNSYQYARDELLLLYFIIIRSTWPFHNTTQLQPAVYKIRVATIYVIETTRHIVGLARYYYYIPTYNIGQVRPTRDRIVIRSFTS